MGPTQGYRRGVAGTSPSRWRRRIEPRRSAVLTIEGGAAAFPRRSHAHEGGASPCESQDDGAPLCCGALRGSLKAVACRLILGRSLDPIMHTPAIFYLTLLAAPLVGAAQNQAGMPVGSFAFTHVTVIDMTGAPPSRAGSSPTSCSSTRTPSWTSTTRRRSMRLSSTDSYWT